MAGSEATTLQLPRAWRLAAAYTSVNMTARIVIPSASFYLFICIIVMICDSNVLVCDRSGRGTMMISVGRQWRDGVYPGYPIHYPNATQQSNFSTASLCTAYVYFAHAGCKVLWSACLSACLSLSSHISNHASKFRQIFWTCYLRAWLGDGLSRTAVQYDTIR